MMQSPFSRLTQESAGQGARTLRPGTFNAELAELHNLEFERQLTE